MGRDVLAVVMLALTCGCTINAQGIRRSEPPAAIQGSDDAQGSPLSVPGAGMGVGSGNPEGPGSARGAPGQ